MAEIAYQNKDIISKALAENLENKSLNVYGLNLPKIVAALPTNLPVVEANELRIDNIFLLEDGSYAIIDYESTYDEKDKVKYLNYITRILARYLKKGVKKIKIRMIVIYTADVERSQVKEFYDYGAMTLQIEPAFLSELDSEEISSRLTAKITNGEPLTDEELMEFIVLPLSYKSMEEKQDSIERQVGLVKKVENRSIQTFLLSGLLVFSDKILDNKMEENIGRWMQMTKIAQMFENEKQEAVKKAREEVAAEKDAEIAKKDAEMAEKDAQMTQKDAEIARLTALLEQSGITV